MVPPNPVHLNSIPVSLSLFRLGLGLCVRVCARVFVCLSAPAPLRECSRAYVRACVRAFLLASPCDARFGVRGPSVGTQSLHMAVGGNATGNGSLEV